MGDIILSNGSTITAEELASIAAEVKKLIAKEAKDPSQYEEVGSLANLTTLPALLRNGSAYKLVRVAVELLRGLDGKEVSLRKTDTALQWQLGDGEWKDLLLLADIKGEKGDPFTYDDFTAEQIADLKRPAMEAADAANQAAEATNQSKEAADKAEALRAAAEVAREQAESSRQSAEDARDQAESDRGESEDLRNTNEDKRIEAELARKASELARIDNESNREASELERQNNELQRQSDTATAINNAEIATTSVTEAANRANNAAEYAISVSNNLPKIENMTWRVFNPSTNQYEDSGVDATGRPPIIQSGTWWLWDYATQAYVDSGQAVNTDFKAYVPIKYPKDIDLTTLSTYEQDGEVKDFISGNLIYVENELEPTGYSVYIYTPHGAGYAWVKIVLITDGMHLILVNN